MSDTGTYKFRLYITGNSTNSVQAQIGLTEMCEQNLPGRYEIQVVDVLETPLVALEEGILMTPTLLKLVPLPATRIVGSLSETQLLLDTILKGS